MRRLLLFAGAIGALVLVLSGQLSAGARGPDLSRAIAALEAHNPQLLNLTGVAGTGVGVGQTGEAVVRVFLERPGVGGIPSHLNGVTVETVVTGRFEAYCTRTSHCDSPVPIGVSTGHVNITAGTLGAKVKDASGNVYALSNNHVFANSNDATLGDPILQPGPYDGGTYPADLLGVLHDFEPIKFDGSNNTMDAAIMRPTTRTLSASTLGGEYTPSSTIVSPTLNTSVKKYGRTTALTTGTIAEVNVTVNVCYAVRGIFCTKSARFVGQFTVTPGSFSAGGDSGSLIVTSSGNNPVGLLFAGSSTRTIASPIGPVLTRFGVTIDSGDGPAPTATNTPASAATATPTPAPTNTPAPTATPVSGTATVSSITYSTSGGRNNDRHLTSSVTVTNGSGQAVSGASVSVTLQNSTTGQSWNGTATTGSNGVAAFTLNNAPSGCYTTTVTNVSASGLTWDGSTPPNQFCK